MAKTLVKLIHNIKKFNSDELKFLIESFLIEYQYEIQNGVTEATPSLENRWFSDC